ncbi:MAG: MBOAT family protein [Oscillospiraceae bacterium]|nr:MBOAT family protein [Oscillospiraceae bacterium]
MVFSNLLFIYLFLPLCLLLYYICKNRTYRNGILIIFSLLFYSFGEPVWVVLLIFSAIVDYLNGLFIEKYRGKKIAVLGVIMSLVINLGLLGVFKYSGFIISNINSLFGLSFDVPQLALPIGISFYTFQTISYTVDVYRDKAKVQHNFLDFLLYVSMFFQLVAGPIVRYTDIAAEIEERSCTAEDMSSGFFRFIIGLGKKVILANFTGKLATAFLTFGDMPSSVLAAWSGVIMYSLQIYFDFSGYSDMAIGMGRMFGFNLTENFNYPYISKSASEFWRRWHMSLGSFFRDYVYIPMGGNRRHQLLNLAVVWFLTGLWHGASWNYILWGLYFGVLIICEKYFLGKLLEKIPAFFSHIYLLIIALFGWTLFYFEDMSEMISCLKGMFGQGIPLSDDIAVSELKGSCFIIAAAVIFCCPVYKAARDKIAVLTEKSSALKICSQVIYCVSMLILLIVCSLLLVKQTYNPFLYFRY